MSQTAHLDAKVFASLTAGHNSRHCSGDDSAAEIMTRMSTTPRVDASGSLVAVTAEDDEAEEAAALLEVHGVCNADQTEQRIGQRAEGNPSSRESQLLLRNAKWIGVAFASIRMSSNDRAKLT